MIEFLQSKSLELIAKNKGRYLHSPYNPVKEAERYVEKHITSPPRRLLLLGASLGYLGLAINKLYPNTKIFALWYFSELRIKSLPFKYEDYWTPSKGRIEDFIHKVIREETVTGLKILTWNPVFHDSSEALTHINKIILDRVADVNSRLATTQGFGLRWIRNSIRNALSPSPLYEIAKEGNKPVVIAASGTSLEEDIPWLKKNHGNYFLLSLPSSLKGLIHHNITVHGVVSTDPGYWASQHLNFLRHLPETFLFTPLSGIPWPSDNIKVVPLYQREYWAEKEILKETTETYLSLPTYGSVIFTAIDIAERLTTGPIILSGLDFYNKDILSHITPHTFDSFFENKVNRLNPLLDIHYKKMLDEAPYLLDDGYHRKGRAHAYYHSYFTKWQMNKRLFTAHSHFFDFYNLPLPPIKLEGSIDPFFSKFEKSSQKASLEQILVNLRRLNYELQENLEDIAKEIKPLDLFQLEGYSENERKSKEEQLRRAIEGEFSKWIMVLEETIE